MIAYAELDGTEATISNTDEDDTATFTTTCYQDDDSTGTTTRIVKSPGLYIMYQSFNIPAPDFDYFDWLWFKREAARKEAVYFNEIYIEHLNRIQIALMFNIHTALYNRRMMFPKSGFLARAGRKKRN